MKALRAAAGDLEHPTRRRRRFRGNVAVGEPVVAMSSSLAEAFLAQKVAAA